MTRLARRSELTPPGCPVPPRGKARVSARHGHPPAARRDPTMEETDIGRKRSWIEILRSADVLARHRYPLAAGSTRGALPEGDPSSPLPSRGESAGRPEVAHLVVVLT